MLTRTAGLLVAIASLGACTTVPTGPSVMVVPAAGKPFEEFQADDASCRAWARGQVRAEPGQIARSNTAGGAAIGTLIGAALGAAFGAMSGHPEIGAAVGAGGGLVFGTASGASAGVQKGATAQQQYDDAYQQCMYAKGNEIPAAAQSPRRYTGPTAAPASLPPPPPPPPPPRP